MAAETVDTYTFKPEPRSTFSPENIQGEPKAHAHRSQAAKPTGKPISVSPVKAK